MSAISETTFIKEIFNTSASSVEQSSCKQEVIIQEYCASLGLTVHILGTIVTCDSSFVEMARINGLNFEQIFTHLVKSSDVRTYDIAQKLISVATSRLVTLYRYYSGWDVDLSNLMLDTSGTVYIVDFKHMQNVSPVIGDIFEVVAGVRENLFAGIDAIERKDIDISSLDSELLNTLCDIAFSLEEIPFERSIDVQEHVKSDIIDTHSSFKDDVARHLAFESDNMNVVAVGVNPCTEIDVGETATEFTESDNMNVVTVGVNPCTEIGETATEIDEVNETAIEIDEDEVNETATEIDEDEVNETATEIDEPTHNDFMAAMLGIIGNPDSLESGDPEQPTVDKLACMARAMMSMMDTDDRDDCLSYMTNLIQKSQPSPIESTIEDVQTAATVFDEYYPLQRTTRITPSSEVHSLDSLPCENTESSDGSV